MVSRFAMHSMLYGKDYMVPKFMMPHTLMMSFPLSLMKKEATVLQESMDEPVMEPIKNGFGAERSKIILERNFQMHFETFSMILAKRTQDIISLLGLVNNI